MCGPYINAQEVLETFGNTILDILFLISKPDEQIFDIMKEDSCTEPFNNNNNDDDNNFAEEFEKNNDFDDSFYSAGPSKNNDNIHNFDKPSELSFEEQSVR